MVLNAQLLDGGTKLPRGKEGIARVVEKLHYVQIDTITVIERAHNHTLWTRRPDYDPQMLHELQAKDRRVFEYWGHAASYLPMSEYRFYLPRMRRFDDPYTKWDRELLDKYGHLLKPVLARIRKEGPLMSKDFETPAQAKRSELEQPKPVKAALAMLVWRGDIMIAERRNFEKIYDLTERVLPDNVDTSVPGGDELGRFLVRAALSAYGVARENEICRHIDAAPKELISNALDDLIDAGELVHLHVEGDEKPEYYALSKILQKAARLKAVPPRVYLLSPFDNLIIQRVRTKRLFGFDYVLECYVPPAKRKYGYYVLPILWDENLVGRLDPKAERKKKTLILRSLVFEKEFKLYNEFLPSFAEKLWELARFNLCEQIEFMKVSPAKIKPALQRHVKDATPVRS